MEKITAAISSMPGGDIVVNATNDGESVCPSLTWRQRLTGCACCVGLGILFSLLNFIAILKMDLVTFSVLFTLGNTMTIAGMLFLAGPMAHIKRMFDEGRWIATTVYVTSMILTLIAALLLHNGLLVLFLCVIQILAMIWYTLSYIPFARDAVKACLGKIIR